MTRLQESLEDFLLASTRAQVSQFENAKIPVNIKQLAYEFKVDNLSYSKIQENGILQRTGNSYSIYLNSSYHPYNQRFTIAHELAHIFIHEFLDQSLFARNFVRSFRAIYGLETFTRIVENVCNNIANRLLLPRPQFIKLAKHLGPSTASIKNLCQSFEVSPEVVLLALKEEEIWDAHVLIWRTKSNKKDGKKLRITNFAHLSKSKFFVPLNKSAPEGSSALVAYDLGQDLSPCFETLGFGYFLKKKVWVQSGCFNNSPNKFVVSIIMPNQQSIPSYTKPELVKPTKYKQSWLPGFTRS